MRLIADIGGTNARFMLVAADGQGRARWDCKVADHPTFSSALIAYLSIAGSPQIKEVCIDVAGPVTGGAAHLTNADWSLSEAALQEMTGAARVRLFNDLEAAAFAIPHLGAACTALDKGEARRGKPGAPCMIIAPGTGLGAGLYVPPHVPGGAGQAFATEAGHARMLLASGIELERLHAVVSVNEHTPETFLSGPGLSRIDYAFNGLSRDGAVIAEGALAGDASLVPVVAAFLDMLARFAGSATLISGAFGGVYLAGGILHSLAPLIDQSRFRRLFNDHPPMAAFLDAVPVQLIKDPEPALLGLASYAFT